MRLKRRTPRKPERQPVGIQAEIQTALAEVAELKHTIHVLEEKMIAELVATAREEDSTLEEDGAYGLGGWDSCTSPKNKYGQCLLVLDDDDRSPCVFCGTTSYERDDE